MTNIHFYGSHRVRLHESGSYVNWCPNAEPEADQIIYSDDIYSVLLPRDVGDICAEARSLCNDLDWMIDRVIGNKCLVAFLRKNDDLKTPLVSLELSPDRSVVRRAEGKSGRETTAEEKEFLEKFQLEPRGYKSVRTRARKT